MEGCWNLGIPLWFPKRCQFLRNSLSEIHNLPTCCTHFILHFKDLIDFLYPICRTAQDLYQWKFGHSGFFFFFLVVCFFVSVKARPRKIPCNILRKTLQQRKSLDGISQLWNKDGSRWKRSFSSALAWIRFPKPLMHWCECTEFVGCSLHCFEGFPTSSKTITSNFDSTWKRKY